MKQRNETKEKRNVKFDGPPNHYAPNQAVPNFILVFFYRFLKTSKFNANKIKSNQTNESK